MPADQKTILVSGGHLTPALATIEYFQKNHPEIKLVFVGRKYSQSGQRQVAKEEEICQQLGIPFYAIDAPKFHRTNWWRNLEEIGKVLPSLWRAYDIIIKERVDLFLSFGGYLALPVALAAKMLRKKVVTHEQTITTGLANQVIAQLSDRVAIAFEESRRFFPEPKTILTGNPIRPSILRTYTRRPAWIPESRKPILYITGGSQGSQVINNTVGLIVDELTQKFLVVHQCGHSEHQRYWHELNERVEALPPDQQASYVVREWIDEKEVSWLFQHADLTLSRSGANTVLEITLHAIPAIFIPLPFAHNNEQYKNAQVLSQAGAAEILEQKDLTPESLLTAIRAVSAQRNIMRKKAQKLQAQLKLDGAKQLAQLCLSLLRS